MSDSTSQNMLSRSDSAALDQGSAGGIPSQSPQIGQIQKVNPFPRWVQIYPWFSANLIRGAQLPFLTTLLTTLKTKAMKSWLRLFCICFYAKSHCAFWGLQRHRAAPPRQNRRGKKLSSLHIYSLSCNVSCTDQIQTTKAGWCSDQTTLILGSPI